MVEIKESEIMAKFKDRRLRDVVMDNNSPQKGMRLIFDGGDEIEVTYPNSADIAIYLISSSAT